jgi:hypothetical protein
MELKVHPNPADLYIIVETGCLPPSAFKMFDMLGRLVMVAEVADKEQLSVAQLDPGQYYYKLTAGSRLQVGKLMIRTESSGA